MIDVIASFDGRIAKVHGPARSGKTEALARRAVHLLDEGVDPASILVEVTNGFAAQAFRRRLAALAGEQRAQEAARIPVRTPLGACTDVLDSPAARAATRRVPRVLIDAEYLFLVEDMKTLGTPLRKLRRMLEHFYRQMEDLRPEANGASAAKSKRFSTTSSARSSRAAPWCATRGPRLRWNS